MAGVVVWALSSLAHGQAQENPVIDNSSSSISRSSSQAGDWSTVKEEAEAQQAAYDAQAAAAKAQSAMYDAQAAATKLKYGGVSGQTAITGTTTVEGDGAKPEAILLVNRSSHAAAMEIYDQIIAEVGKPEIKGRDLVILESKSNLSLSDAILFDFKVLEVESALEVARAKFAYASQHDPGDKEPDRSEQAGRSAINIAGSLVDAAAKLGSYFLTDYGFGGTPTTFKPAAVTYVLASQIKAAPQGFSGKVLVPELFLATDAKLIQPQLERLNRKYVQTLAEQATSKARQSALVEAKKSLEAGHYAQADAAAAKAATLYESMMTTLSAGSADGKQDPFLVRVLKQYRVRNALDKNALVLLLEGESAAQYYTKKNLWTFFGGPPLYTAGGVTVSFALIDRESGELLAAGTAAKHGGYQSIRKVERLYPVEQDPIDRKR